MFSPQVKRFSQWGARLFFSATVAFSVPSIHREGGLLRSHPFRKGVILTAAALIGKLVVGFYAGPPLTLLGFLKLGWAMNGRAEFSFFIAQEASDDGILSAEDYSAVVWALLLCAVASPLAFRKVLAADDRATPDAVATDDDSGVKDGTRGGAEDEGGGVVED